MTEDATVARKSNGLSILWDVIVAPKSAFAALRERPAWFWAFVITSVLGMIGSILLAPVYGHVVTVMFAKMAQTDPRFAQLTPAQQQQQLEITKAIYKYFFIFYPVIVLMAALFTAVLALIANAIGSGTGTFRKYWALAMNIAVVNFGIGYLLIGLIGMLRGPEGYSTSSDVMGAIPSLGWLAAGNVKAATFLSGFNPFGIWSVILLALGLQETGGVKKGVAWGFAIVIPLLGAIVGAAFAQ